MIVPATYYSNTRKKYIVIVEVKHHWNGIVPDMDKPLSVRVYDLEEGLLYWLTIEQFNRMVESGKLRFITQRKDV